MPRDLHPRLRDAIAQVAAVDITRECMAPPPEALERGIEEFNNGAYFEQHETLELLWRATPGEIRYLYQGILQVGVGLYHLFKRRNYHGTVIKLDNGARLLAAFPPVCQGVDVARLRRDAQETLRDVERLGPERIREIERQRAPRVHRVGEA